MKKSAISARRKTKSPKKRQKKHSPLLIFLTIVSILTIPLILWIALQTSIFRNYAQSASFTFTAVGDIGSKPESKAVMDTVGKSGSQLFIALGDMMYEASGEQQWCTEFKSKLNHIEVIAGNHDTGKSSGGNIDEFIKHCPFTLGTLQGTYGKEYYFDYPQTGTPLARFILISPGLIGDYKSGAAGYQFTEKAITEAQSKGIKWVIVGMHYNCITAGTKSCEAGEDIMNLLIQKKVDLILQGHDHIYHRSHALGCMKVNSFDATCIADDGTDGKYEKGKGPVLIINGQGGQEHYKINASDPEAKYFAKSDDTTFGVSKFTVSDSQISAEFLKSTGAFSDTFTITGSTQAAPSGTTNPTFGVIAPCPSCASPTDAPQISAPAQQPNIVISESIDEPVTNNTTNNTVNNTVNNPPPVDPCETDETSVAGEKKNGKHSKENGAVSGIAEALLKFFIELLNLLLKVLGGGQIPVPNQGNNDSPC